MDLPLEPLTSPRGEAHRAAIMAIPFGRYGELWRTRPPHFLLATRGWAGVLVAIRFSLPIIVPCHRVLGAGGVTSATIPGGEVREDETLAA